MCIFYLYRLVSCADERQCQLRGLQLEQLNLRGRLEWMQQEYEHVVASYDNSIYLVG